MLCALTNAARLSCRQQGFGAMASSNAPLSPIPSHIRPTAHPLQQHRPFSKVAALAIGSGAAMTVWGVEEISWFFVLSGTSLVSVGLYVLADEQWTKFKENSSKENKPVEDNPKSTSMDRVVVEDDEE